MTTHATTTVTTHNPVRDDLAPRTTAPAERGASRLWAGAGAGAAVSGLGAIAITSFAGGVYDLEISGDADKILAALNGDHLQLLLFHALAALAAMLLVPFAVGLARRLRSGLPADSLLPGVAAAGMLLTAGILIMGSGLDTEFVMGPHEPGTVVAENFAMYNHWIGTIPWLWTGAGLAGLAIAGGALRHRTVPRWLGLVGLVLGGLTLLLGISPLSYMAGMTGTVWLLVTAIGFVVGDRAHRA